MEYKHEYISDELSGILITMLGSDFCDTVYEEYHVIKAIEKCAYDLSTIVYNQYNELTLIQRVNETYFDTGWYISPHIENNTKIDDMFLTKTKTNHQIKFSFQKMRKNISMQTPLRTFHFSDTITEEMRKNVFTEKIVDDDAIILIQSSFMDSVKENKTEGMKYLETMLGHELRHIVEQYVLEFQNTLLSVKNSLNSDFKDNNIFNLNTNSEEYKKIRNLMYCLSYEEQRARMQATWQMCQKAIFDRSFNSQITTSYNKTLALGLVQDVRGINDNFRSLIICILRSSPFKYVHDLNLFRRILNELIFMQRKDIRKILLIAGYFLYKHRYLTSKKTGLIGEDLSNFFNIENIKTLLNNNQNIDEYLKIIYKVIRRNYNRYENIIYNIIGQNVEKIIRYKSDTDNDIVKFQKMAADNDLKLKDYEVGLINESFNYYSDVLERWLNIEPHYC